MTKMTLACIPVEDITSLRTNVAHYDNVKNIREVVDRHISYIAFEHDLTIIGQDKKMIQTYTVRVKVSDLIAIEAKVGEPAAVNEPF